jgi:L-ribulose-5-phosphate 3-epimerase
MTTISFMGANLVAQQLGWSMPEGWRQGDAAANAHYAPIETFPDRFAAFVRLVTDAGFDSLDVWTAQLHWRWATPAHLDAARGILDDAGVSVVSYAGQYGDTVEEFTAACGVATALGTDILGGNAGLLRTDRAGLAAVLEDTGCRFGIENHPEASSRELLDKVGDGGRIGAAIDTGWWGTQGVDAAQAIRDLGPHVLHVHLKDVRAAGAHETCALGEGIVPVAECVAALAEIGYSGPISIEHEPVSYDPTPEVVLSRTRLLGWLDGAGTARRATP